MQYRIPMDRFDLKIKRSDRVLEVGSGNWPMKRSNVLVDKYVDYNGHRCGDVSKFKHQTFIEADGENLPFNDNEFDYTICNHSLEHAEHPDKYMDELRRVSKKGYIETPSLIGEFLFPKGSHKWVILIIDSKIIFYEKSFIADKFGFNFGNLFLNHLLYSSLIYKLLSITNQLMFCKLEWTDKIEYVINPTDERYSKFFTEPWSMDMAKQLFPRQNILIQIYNLVKYASHLLTSKIINIV